MPKGSKKATGFNNIEDTFFDELKTALDYAEQIIHVIDEDFRVIYANRSFFHRVEEMTNYGPERIIGSHLLEVCPFLTEDIKAEYKKVFTTGKPLVMEEKNTLEGEDFFTRTRKLPLMSDGHVVKVLTIIKDITENKKAERTLRESERNFREAQRVAHVGSWDLNVATGDLSWSDETYRIYGFKPQEFVPSYEKFASILYPEDSERVQQNVDAALSGAVDYDIDFRIVRPNGEIGWLHCEGEVTRNEQGEPVRFFGTQADITERKHAEEALRESEEKYRNLVERANDGICIIEEGVVTYVNSRLAEMWGGTVEEICGTPFTSYLHPDELPKVSERYRRRMAGEDVVGIYETIVRRRDDTLINVELNAGIIAFEGKPADLVIVRDITERKKADETLRESERRYRTLTKNLSVGIYRNTPGPEGEFIEANPAIVKMFGYKSRTEFLKKSVSDLYKYPEERERINRKMLKKGFIRNELLELKKKDGTSFWCSATAVVVRDEEGNIQYYDGIIEDVTDRRKVEAELKESEERFRMMFDSSHDLITIADVDGKTIGANPTWRETLGYSPETQGDPMEKIHPNDKAKVLKALGDFGQSKSEIHNLEYRYRTASGNYVALETTIQQITTGGKPFLYVVAHDVTEQRKADKEIRKKHRQLSNEKQIWEDTFKFMADGITIHNEEHEIIRVNDAFCELLEKRRDEIIGKKCYELFHLRDSPPPFCPMKKTLETRKKAEEEVYEPTLNKYFRISTSLLESAKGNRRKNGGEKDNGKLIGVVHSIKDITELKEREKALEKLNDELRVANKMKSDFVSVVSHDFGNPLGVIQGTIELMEMGAYGELTPKMKEKLVTIQETTKRLNRLRIDTLELAKMDLGQMEMEKKEQNLGDLVRKAATMMKDQAERKRQTIEIHTPDEFMARYDSIRMFRVMENYLSNAIKYTPKEGNIEINVEETGSEMMVCVKDNGRGIPPEELENVFLRFYRIGERVAGSSGLGLSIVKGIMKAHRGRCWAESEGVGKGSTFCFTLPKY